MTELEGLIRFWETKLKDAWFLTEPSVQVHIENTIKHLKELQSQKGGSHGSQSPNQRH